MSFSVKIVVLTKDIEPKAFLEALYHPFTSNWDKWWGSHAYNLKLIGSTMLLKDLSIRKTNFKFQIFFFNAELLNTDVVIAGYYGSSGTILLLPDTNLSTLEYYENWLEIVIDSSNRKELPIIIIQQKESSNALSTNQLESYCNQLNSKFNYSSYKIQYLSPSNDFADNVSTAFDLLGNNYLDYYKSRKDKKQE